MKCMSVYRSKVTTNIIGKLLSSVLSQNLCRFCIQWKNKCDTKNKSEAWHNMLRINTWIKCATWKWQTELLLHAINNYSHTGALCPGKTRHSHNCRQGFRWISTRADYPNIRDELSIFTEPGALAFQIVKQKKKSHIKGALNKCTSG